MARCRWNSAEHDFNPSYEGPSRQSLEEHLDVASGKLTSTLQLIDCEGKACPELVTPQVRAVAAFDDPVNRRSFTLVLTDGQLVDEALPRHPLALRRASDIAADFAGATHARDEVWRHFDNSEFEQLASQGADVFLRTSDALASVRSGTGIAQRDSNVILFASDKSLMTHDKMRKSVLFVSSISGADGRRGVELLVLWQVNDQWRLAYLYYDSGTLMRSTIDPIALVPLSAFPQQTDLDKLRGVFAQMSELDHQNRFTRGN